MHGIKEQAEKLESFNERNTILKMKMEKVTDVVNTNIALPRLLASGTINDKYIYNTATMKVEEERKTIMNLNIKSAFFELINNGMDQD